MERWHDGQISFKNRQAKRSAPAPLLLNRSAVVVCNAFMWLLPLLMWKCCKDAESVQESLEQEQFSMRSAAAHVCSRRGGSDCSMNQTMLFGESCRYFWFISCIFFYLFFFFNECAAVVYLTCLHDVGYCASQTQTRAGASECFSDASPWRTSPRLCFLSVVWPRRSGRWWSQ